MEVIKQYILVVIISIEFIIILLAISFILFFPDLVIPLSSKLDNNKDVLKYVALLPAALTIWVFKESRILLFPEEDINKSLQKWKDYWKWKIHFQVGLFYAVFFAITGLTTWIIGLKITEPTGFIMLLGSVLGGLVVVVSIYMARISQSEILLNNE